MDKKITLIRNIIIILSQLLGATVCIYFIYHAKDYEVSSTLFSYLFPSLLAKFNNILSNTGTFILFLPLTIIILSLLFPNSISLKITGAFFGIFSSFFVIMSGFLKNTLQETYNLQLFFVHRVLTITEKIQIFQKEYFEKVSEYQRTKKPLYDYLLEQLAANMDKYTVKLNTLREAFFIKQYSKEIILELTDTFLDNKKNTFLFKETILSPGVFKVVVTISLILGGLVLLRYFFISDDLHLGGAKVMVKAADAGSSTGELVAENTENIAALAENAQKLVTHIAVLDNKQAVIPDLLSELQYQATNQITVAEIQQVALINIVKDIEKLKERLSLIENIPT